MREQTWTRPAAIHDLLARRRRDAAVGAAGAGHLLALLLDDFEGRRDEFEHFAGAVTDAHALAAAARADALFFADGHHTRLAEQVAGQRRATAALLLGRGLRRLGRLRDVAVAVGRLHRIRGALGGVVAEPGQKSRDLLGADLLAL